MSRRRLRVVCSSDEEEEEQPLPNAQPPPDEPHQQLEDLDDDVIIGDIETEFQTVTLNSLNPTPNTNSSTTNRNSNHIVIEPIPLNISDDDIENFTIDNNTSTHSNYGTTNDNNHANFEVSDSPVNRVMESLGLRLKKEWLDSCISGLQATVWGFQGMDDSAKAKLCFQQFLLSDMNYCGAGVLPLNVHMMHLVDLKGPFVLQVDEMVNISCNLRGRYQNAAPGIKRCLKLSMTDGFQRVFGMEYRPIKDLEALAPAGMKIAICNVNVRHGLLMLVPEVVEVLGGSVEELDAARHRLIAEINKPPRGKRNRNGVVPSLATRATLAAWRPNNIADPGNVDRTTNVNTTPLQPIAQGIAPSNSENDRHRQPFAVPSSVNREEHNIPASRPSQASEQGGSFGISTNSRPRQGFAVPVSRNNAEPFIFSAQRPQRSSSASVPGHSDEPVSHVMTSPPATGQTSTPDISVNHVPVEDDMSSVAENINGPDPISAVDMDVEEISMVNGSERAFLFSRDKEMPFTYLVSLSAKLAAIEDQGSVVRGKIKCFVTGVKKFQYKQKDTYELLVFVDDGSLITEILIDHNVVQNRVGYSPQEVTSAATSSDPKIASDMKDIMRQFQLFLINFEGTMLVEMNKSSIVPVATEMNQGCPASDALLLLKRIKSSYSFVKTQGHSEFNPINLS